MRSADLQGKIDLTAVDADVPECGVTHRFKQASVAPAIEPLRYESRRLFRRGMRSREHFGDNGHPILHHCRAGESRRRVGE